MPRAGLSADAVVDAAMAIVDASGPDAVTLSAVADSVGVRVPSLYKHVASLADLRARLGARAIDELATALEQALDPPGDEPAASMMRAYRRWANAFPQRYAMVPVAAPEPGSVVQTAADRFVGIAVAALAPYGLHGDDAIHAVRCLRSAIHGFSSIEAAGGFGLPVDLEASHEMLVAMVCRGLRAPR